MDVELNLNSETVEQLSPQRPLVVTPEATLRDVLCLLREENSGSCLVCREGVLVGIFTERDALRAMSDRASLETPIGQLMVPRPITVRSGDTVGAAIRKMFEGGYRRLPIVDERGRPLGIVRVSGLVHYLVQHFPKSVYNLPPSPQTVLADREGP